MTVTAAAGRASALTPWALPLALGLLLVTTLWLCLPLMLWDHIDLVPIYDAWQRGDLAASEFWRLHDGSHFHAAAYAVLLATTWLSGGQPWLDCLAGWAFYALFAWTLWRLVADGWRGAGAGRWAWGAMLLLVAHPGHLANLQWGWQVAVFISLLGAVVPIHWLTALRPTGYANAGAVVLAVLGVLGFSTTLAVFPVALALIATRGDWAWSRRSAFALPWLLVGAGLLAWLLAARSASVPTPGLDVLVPYVLNYLGGGVLRFAEDVAPWWTLLALVVAIPAALRCRSDARARPWLALMAFALGCAVLTGLGRAGAFGPAHAFVTRYASFALVFWVGWLGLMVLAWGTAGGPGGRGLRMLAVVTLVFAAANGLHLGKKAWVLHQRAEAYAALLRAQYPQVDPVLMDAAYGDRASVALRRLDLLRRWGFAPFDAPPGSSD